ncbi:hypothetical protein SALB1_1099 [Salinisphaera sp. LB1]|nr:hypothetical protein SALB1_1099 [Salinisphaera sp. LB1]
MDCEWFSCRAAAVMSRINEYSEWLPRRLARIVPTAGDE